MKHVVMFSGGVGSYCAAKRVIERHGRADTILLFADVKMEDGDLYRFLEDAEQTLGVPITRISDGRNPWEVFRDVRYLGNSRVDPCSKILKRNLLDKWRTSNFKPEECVSYVGIDWTEYHRFDDGEGRGVRLRLLPYIAEAPMCEPPLLSKDDMKSILSADGIKLPRLYDMGFPHNNCGGFCIKAGQAHFALLLEKMPERYAFHEKKEKELREFLGKDVSILRDRRGGKSKTLTLEEFRKRISCNDYDKEEWGGCGCAIDADDSNDLFGG